MGEDLAHHRAGVRVVLDEEGMNPGKVGPWRPRGGLTFLGSNDLPAALFLLVHDAPGIRGFASPYQIPGQSEVGRSTYMGGLSRSRRYPDWENFSPERLVTAA